MEYKDDNLAGNVCAQQDTRSHHNVAQYFPFLGFCLLANFMKTRNLANRMPTHQHVYDWRQSLGIMGYIGSIYYQWLMSNSSYKRRGCYGLLLEKFADTEEEKTYGFQEPNSNADSVICKDLFFLTDSVRSRGMTQVSRIFNRVTELSDLTESLRKGARWGKKAICVSFTFIRLCWW